MSILEEGMATLCSILAWRIPMDRGAWWAAVTGPQRAGHDWTTKPSTVCIRQSQLPLYPSLPSPSVIISLFYLSPLTAALSLLQWAMWWTWDFGRVGGQTCAEWLAGGRGWVSAVCEEGIVLMSVRTDREPTSMLPVKWDRKQPVG